MVSHAEVLTAALGQVPDGDPKVAKAARAFVMGLKGGRDAIKGGVAAERKAAAGKSAKGSKTARRRVNIPEPVLKYIEENIDGCADDPKASGKSAGTAAGKAAGKAPAATPATGDDDDIVTVVTDYSWLSKAPAQQATPVA